MNMNDVKDFLNKLIPASSVAVALDANRSFENACRILLETKHIPEKGWDDQMIERLLQQLASFDSNNFIQSKCGVGEREARIASQLVHKRHYGFCHGIGRSGDLAESQPKAVGSTILNQLTNSLILHLFKIIGLRSIKKTLIIPMATGMTLSLCLQMLKKKRQQSAKYVLWSRIDQKSCFKCILAANLIPIIIAPIPYECNNGCNNLKTDIETFQRKIIEIGNENILCIYSTTSCFAPRQPDDIIKLSKLAYTENIPHLVNNAYGLQCKSIVNKLEHCLAGKDHRIDLIVQSTDKNLMVPIGAAIIASNSSELIDDVAQQYCGRASISPIMDVFITLMSLGQTGYLQLLSERTNLFHYLNEQLRVMLQNDFNVIHDIPKITTQSNQISICIPLGWVVGGQFKDITEIGSMLFKRHVSGARVISGNERKMIEGYEFHNWGGHFNNLQIAPYLTIACAIGMTKNDVDLFIRKFKEVLKYNKLSKVDQSKG